MEQTESGLCREAVEHVRAAALALERTADCSPSAFDYLTWADACTVHMPDDPIRARVQEVRAAALRSGAWTRSEAPAECRDALTAALAQLVQDAQCGYRSLLHTMEFPVSSGFCPASGVQSADVFTRAIVLELLAGAQRAGVVSCGEVLERGVEYLVRARRRSGSGAWAYFPGLVELAPDADTLAQVARALWLAGRTDLVEQYVVPVLKRYDRASANGSLDTWLYDENENIASIQQHWAANAWGTGADPEVLANLVDCIDLVAPHRFPSLVQRMRCLLIGAAQDGAWTSTWYHGPYYGTYVCTRALARVAGAQTLLLASRRFLHRTQNEDGGWGWQTGRSDPLNTALALSTLRTLQANPSDAPVSRGLEYLERCAQDGGIAAPVPFIKMNLGRASGREGPVLSFASPSITAAYAANALVQWKGALLAVS